MNFRNLKLAALAATTVLAATSFSQEVRVPDRTGGYYADSPYNRLYNTNTMVTFTGKVTGIQEVSPMKGMAGAVTYLVRASNGGTAIVDAGPAWFINNQVAKVHVGNQIQVTGSKVMIDGKGQILASQIVIGKKVLALRRASGFPYWDAYAVNNNVQISNSATIEGRVIGTNTYMINDVPYYYMTVGNGSSNVYVDLGPQWFYNRQNIVYRPGDYVQVLGMGTPYTVGNVTIVPSYSIYRGNDVFTLRGNDGYPVWYGGR